MRAALEEKEDAAWKVPPAKVKETSTPVSASRVFCSSGRNASCARETSSTHCVDERANCGVANRATQSAGCEGQAPCWAETGGAHSARICHVQHCDVSLEWPNSEAFFAPPGGVEMGGGRGWIFRCVGGRGARRV